MKQKINLSTLWLCKLHIKHNPTPHRLSKPSGKNKLQTSVVAQENLAKHVAAQNCHWRKYRQQCSEFHTVLAWRSYEHHLQQHSEIFIFCFRGIWNRIPLFYPHSHQKAHSKQQEKKNEKTKKKSSVNYLLQLAEGKGYYLYCQQHIMKPQVSKTWPEQQNILWITATGDTLPYACNELEDKKFVPHWNFHFSRFNPPACEARNKLYTTYQWRVGMETISWALSRAKQTISCIIRSYWRK